MTSRAVWIGGLLSLLIWVIAVLGLLAAFGVI
jgi:hypothetical protein